jgi:hypothetical protein
LLEGKSIDQEKVQESIRIKVEHAHAPTHGFDQVFVLGWRCPLPEAHTPGHAGLPVDHRRGVHGAAQEDDRNQKYGNFIFLDVSTL